jgi:hypothetical protein
LGVVVSGLVSPKDVFGESLFQAFAVIETIEVTVESGLAVGP